MKMPAIINNDSSITPTTTSGHFFLALGRDTVAKGGKAGVKSGSGGT